jgi:hypothetical protein
MVMPKGGAKLVSLEPPNVTKLVTRQTFQVVRSRLKTEAPLSKLSMSTTLVTFQTEISLLKELAP